MERWLVYGGVVFLLLGSVSFLGMMAYDAGVVRKQQLADLDELSRLVEEKKKEAEAKRLEEERIAQHAVPSSLKVVVNKRNPLQPTSFAPDDLVTIYGATIRKQAASSFEKMYLDAQKAGQGFRVTSSYRSYQSQVETYNYWVGYSGQKEADTYSAKPGYSEHQTGLAVDVAAGNCALSCFGSTAQYTWLRDNAHTYGFIQRYIKGYEETTGYSAEEWHYRYIGEEAAQDMHAKGVKTLEEYWRIEGGDYV